MSEPAHAIAIPRSSDSFPASSSAFRFEPVFSPHTMASPLSIASPFSASSGGSLGGEGRASNASSGDGVVGHSAGTMLASSFATTVSSYSDVSPPQSFAEHDGKSAKVTGGGGSTAQSATAASVTSDQSSAKKHKPHKCDVCGACFARKVHLQRHSLRHQVCKPYCCDRCSKCFSRQDSLVRHHRLLHEKAKPDKKGGDKNKEGPRACVRCSSIAVPCDGQSPCDRCLANHGGQSCVYAPSSSPLTIGAATAKSLKRAKKQGKTKTNDSGNDASAASSTASDVPSWSTFSRTGRRDTISSAASGWSEASTTSPFQNEVESLANKAWNIHNMQNTMPPLYGQTHQLEQWQLQQLHAQQIDTNHGGQLVHPFDMLQMGNDNGQEAAFGQANGGHAAGDIDMQTDDDNLMPQLLSLIGISGQETPMPRGHVSQNAVNALHNIDWNSMLHNLQQNSQHSFQQTPQQQQQHNGGRPAFAHDLAGDVSFHAGNIDTERLPFTMAASDKAMNATLFNAMDQQGSSSDYASPAMSLGTPMPSMPATSFAAPQQPQQVMDHTALSSATSPPNGQPLSGSNGNDVVSLAALGIPVPPTLHNISLPANLQMSPDHWDNFMRCLSSYALTRQHQQQQQQQQHSGNLANGAMGQTSATAPQGHGHGSLSDMSTTAHLAATLAPEYAQGTAQAS